MTLEMANNTQKWSYSMKEALLSFNGGLTANTTAMPEEFVPVGRKCHYIKTPVDCTVHDSQHVSEKPASHRGLYDIQGVIGIGGGGTVYSGTRVADGRRVALKFIQKDTVNKWGLLNDCYVPVEFWYLHVLSGITGVIEMLDWFRENDVYVLVMECIPHAMDLDELLDDQGPFPEGICRYIFQQVANTILQCHANQIVHRDIKVENVLINALTHEVKVIDFGCGTRLKNIPELRRCGTAIFYPPEWYTEECYYGERLDVWCLGILLYMLVEGQVPFEDKDEILNRKARHRHGKKFSKSYQKLVKSMMHKDQERRTSLKDVLAHPWLQADSKESEVGKKRGLFRMFRRLLKR